MKNIILLVVSIFVFTGCGSTAKVPMPKPVVLPQWYINAPSNTVSTLYGVGVAENLKEAKVEALRDMSEKLVVQIKSSFKTTTSSSSFGSYNKEMKKELQVDAKKITFSNYKVENAVNQGSDFYVLVSVNRDKLFAQRLKEFTLLDNNINIKSKKVESVLEKIKTINDLKPSIQEAKNLAYILYTVKNSFKYQDFFRKYNNLFMKMEKLKNSLKIIVKSNTKNTLYKTHLVSLLNKNGYKIVNKNADVKITIKNRVKNSKAMGWYIAKVSSTIKINTNNKNTNTTTINTIGRSSISKDHILVDSAKNFQKKIAKLGINKILF